MWFIGALVSPMVGLSAVEASIFSSSTVFLVLRQFFKFGRVGWETGKGNGRVLLFIRVRGADIRSSSVKGGVAGGGAWGVVHTPSLVKFFS
jgi:hypothetical protein